MHEQTCNQCHASFPLNDQDHQLLRQLQLPTPQLCPDCRRKRRLALWPYGNLHKRQCDFSGETIITTYPKNARFPVYKRNHWLGDQWTAPEMEIDWDRPFMDQLYELQSKTPHFHQLGRGNENCDYADDAWDCKNIYMSRSMANCEDLLHSYRVLDCKNSVDLTYCYDCSECYECTYCFDCYNVKYSLDSRNCSDSFFLYNCNGCRDSFMCWNLRNKQYCILNKQYSKEEYESKIASLKLSSRKFVEELKKEFVKHLQKDAIHKATQNVNTQNVTGNYNTDCKDCTDVFFLENAENVNYSYRSPATKSSSDMCGLYKAELCYEVCQSEDLNNVQFALYSVGCQDSQYIDQCFNVNHCFGCVGLKRKSFCILNKQYSKEEYEKLLPGLIKKMKQEGVYGEFFPYRFTYNGFNASLAHFFYPDSEDQIKQLGGYFEEMESSHLQGESSSLLPDRSEEISDALLGKPYECNESGQIFNFVSQELSFYKKHQLPLPALHPEIRNEKRFNQLPKFSPRTVRCHSCQQDTTTYFEANLGYEKIVCEECYLKLVY